MTTVSAMDEALAASRSGLACDRRQPGEAGGLLGLDLTQFRHVGAESDGCGIAQPWNAREYHERPPPESDLMQPA
jgi:hypothetical protein